MSQRSAFQKLFVILVPVLTLTFASYSFAIEMYLDIEGVNGESTTESYENQIDVLAFSEGASSPAASSTSGGGAGKAHFQDISVTKWLDVSSPVLRLALAKGAPYPKVTLTVVKSTGDRLNEFFKIELFDVFITSISSGGSGGEDRLTENLSMAFSKIRWTYTPVDERGGEGSPIVEGWNVATQESF